MKQCPNCKAKVSDEAKSCPKCGERRPADGWEPLEVRIPFFSKLIRAATLDADLYEAAEHDPATIRHSAITVLLACVLSGIGLFLWCSIPIWFMLMQLGSASGFAVDFLKSALAIGQLTIILWAVSAFAISFFRWVILTLAMYLAGVTVLGGTAEIAEVGRSIGFAYIPIALQVFLFLDLFMLPSLQGWTFVVIYFLTNIWMILALIIALRQSLDFSTGKAVVAVILGGIIYFIIDYAISLILLNPTFILVKATLLPQLPIFIEMGLQERMLASMIVLIIIGLLDMTVLWGIFAKPSERRLAD